MNHFPELGKSGEFGKTHDGCASRLGSLLVVDEGKDKCRASPPTENCIVLTVLAWC